MQGGRSPTTRTSPASTRNRSAMANAMAVRVLPIPGGPSNSRISPSPSPLSGSPELPVLAWDLAAAYLGVKSRSSAGQAELKRCGGRAESSSDEAVCDGGSSILHPEGTLTLRSEHYPRPGKQIHTARWTWREQWCPKEACRFVQPVAPLTSWRFSPRTGMRRRSFYVGTVHQECGDDGFS